MYALDVPTIPLAHGTRDELEATMNGHVLAAARLVGKYQRPVGSRGR